MKVYISVDIEGITGVTSWNETELGHSEHLWAREQMVKETIAACEGAMEAGAREIIVKDAHDSARNLDISKLPKGVQVIRGWASSPESMMAGIDESFDATIFVGYHSAGGLDGNPLAHTMNSTKATYIKINGEIASEFWMNSLVSAYYQVPVVFLSGDKMLCDDSIKLVENMETIAVKTGVGDATFNMHPEEACQAIKAGVVKGLKNKDKCQVEIPDEFKLEIRFNRHQDAKRASYYPGVKQIDAHTIEYMAKDIQDMMIARMFVL